MFELIGLAFDTLILFALAVLAGSVFAFMAWLIVRQRACRRWGWVLGARSVPVAAAAYLWLCIALLPGESLFGDFSEKLPNGYVLTGLVKMPDFSYLEKEGEPYWNQPTPSCIERLQVIGPIIVGQYGEQCRTTEPNAQSEQKLFIFDTKSGSLRNFDNLPQAENVLGRPAHFVDSQSFKSSETSAVWQRRVNKVAMIAPPVLAVLTYFIWMFRLPRGDRVISPSPAGAI